MQPWERLAAADAADGVRLELYRRGGEYLIRADGRDLMSSDDESSARSLAELGCAHVARGDRARILVGGLGMGYTLRAALDRAGPEAAIEVAELVAAVVEWNRGPLSPLARRPLEDPRTELRIEDVRKTIRGAGRRYDAILLDVDNGPEALAHAANDGLYSSAGVAEAWAALRDCGVLGVWSYSDDRQFTSRLERQGFEVSVHGVSGSGKGRGRRHVVWIARRAGNALRS